MRVFINDACGKMFTGTINYFRSRVRKILTHLGDLTVLDQHIRTLQDTFFFIGPYRGIPDQDRLLFRVGLSDNTELVLWLTRRITKSIWNWLRASQETLLDEPVQVFMNSSYELNGLLDVISSIAVLPQA